MSTVTRQEADTVSTRSRIEAALDDPEFAGLSGREIARRLGCRPQSVCEAMAARRGYRVGKGGPGSKVREEVQDFLSHPENAIFTVAEIAEMLGVDKGTVYSARESMPDAPLEQNVRVLKRREIAKFLASEEGRTMSDTEAARHLGVHRKTVKNARKAFPNGVGTLLRPESIRLDGGTQLRVAADKKTVEEYAEAYKAGDKFPPPDVFYDGTDYWPGDGHQRIEAAIEAGLKTIECNVHQGTVRDAVLFSAGANKEHGTRRTRADARNAIEKLLRDEEWGTWSDNEISKRCKVTDKTVTKARFDLSSEIPKIDGTRTCRRGGTIYQQKVDRNRHDRPRGRPRKDRSTDHSGVAPPTSGDPTAPQSTPDPPSITIRADTWETDAERFVSRFPHDTATAFARKVIDILGAES